MCAMPGTENLGPSVLQDPRTFREDLMTTPIKLQRALGQLPGAELFVAQTGVYLLDGQGCNFQRRSRHRSITLGTLK